MLKIQETSHGYELKRNRFSVIATWNKLNTEDFSPDVEKLLQGQKEIQVRIIPEDEYQYFLDVEEMLVSLQMMLKEKVEDET